MCFEEQNAIVKKIYKIHWQEIIKSKYEMASYEESLDRESESKEVR